MQNGEGFRPGDNLNIASGEDTTADTAGPSFFRLRESKLILLLCVIAAIHVLLFASVFPFFAITDETEHFDVVIKYSHGHVPRGLETFSPESCAFIALMATGEYSWVPTEGPLRSAPWTEPREAMQRDMESVYVYFSHQDDYEVSQPPLYYCLAGLWWRIGNALGLDDGHVLYWLRFLNVPLIVALVWLSRVIARAIFPGSVFIRLGVPALLAFMPQTVFYSIGNDVLPALFFGAVFFCLYQWLSLEKPSALLGAATGLALAGTYLSLTTTIPMLAVAALTLFAKIQQLFRHGKSQSVLPALAAFLGCAVLPVLPWLIWCETHFGGLTGAKLKIDYFGWKLKPFGEWWHHPIFTPAGLWTYLTGQLGTFWQEGARWHHLPMALPGSNVFYTIFTLGLLAIALCALLRRDSTTPPAQRYALFCALGCFVASLAFFAFMSIIYDFGNCPNPSRKHPYFHAGRMFLGVLIPFLLLIVYGLDRLLGRLGTAEKFIVLTTLAGIMLATEIITDWPAFFSPFNWYHLP